MFLANWKDQKLLTPPFQGLLNSRPSSEACPRLSYSTLHSLLLCKPHLPILFLFLTHSTYYLIYDMFIIIYYPLVECKLHEGSDPLVHPFVSQAPTSVWHIYIIKCSITVDWFIVSLLHHVVYRCHFLFCFILTSPFVGGSRNPSLILPKH